MSYEKHTPGPWKWADNPGSGIEIYGKVPFKSDCAEFVLKADYQRLFSAIWIQFEPREWTEMQIANARLIACAPELLQALESLVERFEKAVVLSGTDKEFARIATTAERALIAKARGQG